MSRAIVSRVLMSRATQSLETAVRICISVVRWVVLSIERCNKQQRLGLTDALLITLTIANQLNTSENCYHEYKAVCSTNAEISYQICRYDVFI